MAGVRKEILIYGLGRSNMALCQFLQKKGEYVVYLSSDNQSELAQFCKDQNTDNVNIISLISPEEACSRKFTEIYLTPGIPTQHPIQKQQNRRNEIEFALPFFSKARFIGITGSNGKSTTCKLFHDYLAAQGFCCAIAGNYGRSLCSFLDNAAQYDFIILELSSFQLHTIKTIFLDFALICSLEPNHLDWHTSLQEYIHDKTHILNLRLPNAPAIISQSVLNHCPQLLKQHSNIYASPLGHNTADTANTANSANAALDYIKESDSPCPIDKINFLYDFLHLMKLTPFDTSFRFQCLTHRMEKGRSKSGISWINDSKSTTPGATIFALQNCHSEHIRLVLGGKDKKIPFPPFVAQLQHYKDKIKKIYIYGEVSFYAQQLTAAGFISAAFSSWPDMLKSLQQETNKHDCLLLSPGFSSLDQFSSYEQRGISFKEFVQNL